MKRIPYEEAQVTELLYQALETEQGGEQVYQRAIRAAQNDDLREEWTKYLDETKHHHDVLLAVFKQLGLDPEAQTPGRAVVRHIGKSLAKAIEQALAEGDAAAAQLVAAECVVLAETKDHMNWELIGHVAKNGKGDWVEPLKQAFEEVEKDEDHHLYHTKGWTRELWVQALGLPAALPPPEEVKKVETAIGAARAENARDGFVQKQN
jgi:rubrerythrin